jgi:CRP-like cAMP-binding protein
MSLEQEVELIRQFPIFSKIAPAMQKLLCFGSERLTYDAGQVMIQVGDAADAAYVIIEGSAEISVPTPRGSVVVNTIGRNEIIGEIAIFGDMPRTATVTAVSKVEVLRISKDLFINVVRQNPDAALELIKVLVTRLANTTQQLIKSTQAAK